MTSTTQSFQWIDRDTAARDLFQLAHHAPEYIRNQAWKLLSAIRSPALIPELKVIALDANNSHALAAFNAIAATSGNFHLPELEMNKQLSLDCLIRLLENHPVNADWIVPLIEQKIPYQQHELFRLLRHYIPELVIPRLIALYEENPLLLDLKMAWDLYKTGNLIAQEWLHGRWDELIYLCLIYAEWGTYAEWGNLYDTEMRLFQILDEWPELKSDLFRRCPAIQEEVEQDKKTYTERDATVSDFRLTPIWRRWERIYEQAVAGDEIAIETLCKGAKTRSGWRSEAYVAAYFVSQLAPRNTRAFDVCLDLLKPTDGNWLYPSNADSAFYESFDSPSRYEAAFALSKIATPAGWEAMVETWFLLPSNSLQRHLHRWIAHMTDQLSGIDSKNVEYPLSERDQRIWFHWLLEPSPQSAAMYAEYYGVNQPGAGTQADR